jgi:hypothetical protein
LLGGRQQLLALVRAQLGQLADCGQASSRSPGRSGEASVTRLRSSNKPSCNCPCSTRVRIEALLSAVIQPMPSISRSSAMALWPIMPLLAHHHQLSDAKTLAQALHLGHEGGAVGHVALVHRHRHRSSRAHR